MPIETDYDPKYVDLDDVPISGPDEYSAPEKRKAVFNAEADLELRVNSGIEIAPDDVVQAHRAAVMNLATHVLTHAAEEPSDVTLGDMEDGGGTITEYSSVYMDRYMELIDSIQDSDISDSDTGIYSTAVNTAADDPNDSDRQIYTND